MEDTVDLTNIPFSSFCAGPLVILIAEPGGLRDLSHSPSPSQPWRWQDNLIAPNQGNQKKHPKHTTPLVRERPLWSVTQLGIPMWTLNEENINFRCGGKTDILKPFVRA